MLTGDVSFESGQSKRQAETKAQLAVARRFTRVLRAFIILSVLLILSLIAFFAVSASRATDRAVRDTEKLSRTLTSLVEDQVLGSLQNVELFLNVVRNDLIGGDADPLGGVRDALGGNPILRGVVITDADGRIQRSSYAAADIGFDISQCEFYRKLVAGKSPFVIGAPEKGRHFSDTSANAPGFIPVATRVFDRAGSFQGVVVAALNPEVFRLHYQTIADNNDATVTLRRYDGVLLVGGGAPGSVGASLAADPTIFRTFLPDRELGTYTLPANISRGARIVSFSVTRFWPVVVSVAIDRDAALAGSRQDMFTTGIVTLLTIILISGSAALMAQQLITLRRQSDLLRRREEEATAARYQLEIAINSMSDAFCLFDKDDRLTIANRTFRETYKDVGDVFRPGRTFEEIMRAIVAKGHIPAAIGREEEWIAERMRAHFNPGEPFEQESADGTWRRVMERRTPDGGIVGLRTEITELKARERQLVEAREAAEAANVAKSQFLAQMSHEIRTPMNAIVGTAALLRDGRLDSDQSGLVEMIDKSAYALLRIINDILDFSRLEAGQMTMEPLSYDLVETIKDVIDLVSPEAAAKHLPIRTLIDTDVATWLYGDQGRLRQVIVNLIGNAIKFTQRGEIQLTVTSAREPGDNTPEMLEIAVIDTGIGISSEARAKLFRHFEQGEAGVHRRFGGSGLGLAISAKIVEAMGGVIGVDSVPGLGSRFWFRIPVARSNEPHDRRAPDSTERMLKPTGARLRVLVAEDNQINQRVIRGLLERLGHACQTVSNGLEAVRAVQTTPFDLVLMDIQMPEMDGVEAARAIRSLGHDFAELPIIAVTANVMPGDAAIYLGVGMNAVLPKPIQPHALMTMLAGHAPALPAPPAGARDDLMVVDQAAVAEMREAVGADVFASAVRDLAEDMRRHLATVSEGIGKHRPDDLRKGAHSLSSLFSTFGLANAGAAFGRVEELVRCGEADDAFALASELHDLGPTLVARLLEACSTEA